MPRDDGIAMSWFVKVEGRVYGHYTGAQMRAFVGATGSRSVLNVIELLNCTL